MIKKLLVGALAFVSFAGASWANVTRPDQFTLKRHLANGDTTLINIDFDGNVLPGRNVVSDLGGGSTTNYWRTIYVGSVVTSSGLQSDHESLTAPSSATIDTARVGGISISTANLWNQSSSYINTDIVQSSVPRNIVMSASFSVSAANIGTTTFMGSATFYGLDSRGASVQETIFFSTSTTPQGSYANPAFISTFTGTNANNLTTIGIGNVAFAVISSFTIQVTSTSLGGMVDGKPVILNIGYGNKFGLSNTIVLASDVYKVTELSGLDTTANPAVTINPSPFNTVSFANPPNGINRFDVWYRCRRSTP